jgi:hypothetical protein
VTSSLRALLTSLIDYAGLFPPAKLPLDLAISNYARYRQEPESWMLGRFVIPAKRLMELEPYHDELFQTGVPFTFSVLGPNDPTWTECREHLNETLASLKAFRQRHDGRAFADVLEMKVPSDCVVDSDPKATAERLSDIGAIIELAGFADLKVFFEFGFDRGESAVATVLEAIAISNRDAPPLAGFKLRTGGLEAEAFPTAEQIAYVIRNAAMNYVPLKATAGLHHPFPRFDLGIQAKMHGFINVFGAAVLGYTRHLEPSMLVKMLADENPTNFVFDEAGFRYGVVHSPAVEIAGIRKDGVISFGSCSFDEPRDDLRKLGWLP